MVQIVGNLEWELLKNVEIRKYIYGRITNTRFVNPLSRIPPISRKITYFLFCSIKLCLYDMKYGTCKVRNEIETKRKGLFPLLFLFKTPA